MCNLSFHLVMRGAAEVAAGNGSPPHPSGCRGAGPLGGAQGEPGRRVPGVCQVPFDQVPVYQVLQ